MRLIYPRDVCHFNAMKRRSAVSSLDEKTLADESGVRRRSVRIVVYCTGSDGKESPVGDKRCGEIMKHRNLVRRVIAWLGGLDLILLLSVLTIVLGALIFIVIADLVAGGATVRIDDRLIHFLRNPAVPTDPIGPERLEDVVRDLTSVGSAAILGLVTAVVVGFLLIRRTYHACAGSWCASSRRKGVVERSAE